MIICATPAGNTRSQLSLTLLSALRLHFSQTKFSGNTVRMKAINGVIQEDLGDEVTVKYSGGNTVKTNKKNLTMRDGPSPITLRHTWCL